MAIYPGRDSAGILKAFGYIALFVVVMSGLGLYDANKTYEATGDINQIKIVALLAIGFQFMICSAFCFAISAAAENSAVLREEVVAIRDELKKLASAVARIESQSVKLPS